LALNAMAGTAVEPLLAAWSVGAYSSVTNVPPAASDWPDLKEYVGTSGVPPPVPSSLASKPSPVSA
jgi:hypothetical protein